MRLILVSALAFGLFVASPALGLEADSDRVVRWEDFDDPDFDPGASREVAPLPKLSSRTPSRASSIELGPLGVDENGVEGRIHSVVTGETLWDISDAYLGTPWVWPSVWHENDAIDDPHLIEPGDRIWITSTEMRRVTPEEAEEFLTAAANPRQETVAADFDALPAEADQQPLVFEELPAPASVEDEPELPIATPLAAASTAAMTGKILTIPPDHDTSFATSETMDMATAILDAPSIRVLLTQGDDVYLGLGDGEVEVGDQFTIFREIERVRDPDSREVLGYHVDALGWLSVRSVEGESSIARIHGSTHEIERGDRIIPRELVPHQVAVREAQTGLEGKIAFTPGYRWMMGSTDRLYINIGEIHGVEVGTALEVYESGAIVSEHVRGAHVRVPDSVVARMVVITVQPETSVAFVLETRRELGVGDLVRGANSPHYAAR